MLPWIVLAGGRATFRPALTFAVKMLCNLQWKQHSKYILAVFHQACSDPEFQGRWMSADTWATVINMYYDVPEPMRLEGATINKAVSKDRELLNEMRMMDNVGPNHCGIFCASYKPGRKMAWCYYSMRWGEVPRQTGKWTQNIDEANDLLEKRVTRGIRRLITNEFNVVRPEDRATEIKRVKARLLNAASENFMSSRNESNALASSLAAQNYSFTYWESTEAKHLFQPLDNETVRKAIDNQLKLLQKCINNIMGTWISLKT